MAAILGEADGARISIPSQHMYSPPWTWFLSCRFPAQRCPPTKKRKCAHLSLAHSSGSMAIVVKPSEPRGLGPEPATGRRPASASTTARRGLRSSGTSRAKVTPSLCCSSPLRIRRSVRDKKEQKECSPAPLWRAATRIRPRAPGAVLVPLPYYSPSVGSCPTILADAPPASSLSQAPSWRTGCGCTCLASKSPRPVCSMETARQASAATLRWHSANGCKRLRQPATGWLHRRRTSRTRNCNIPCVDCITKKKPPQKTAVSPR